MKEIKDLLTKGLSSGFAGKTTSASVVRGGFPVETSHYEGKEGIYHDEWFANRIGGGQEIVEVSGKKYTRVYAGGVIHQELLNELGITKKDITGYLKKKLLELKGETRLFDECEPNSDDEWSYLYTIIDRELEIPLTAGKEEIQFRGKTVFVHEFLLCPVE